LGYGKTVLLADYFKKKEGKIAWLTCSSEMSSAKLFFYNIVSSLKFTIPEFGNDAISYLSEFESTVPEDFLTIFINDAELNIKDEIILVLDDFFVLEEKGVDPAVYVFLNGLLSDMPQFLKLIISSRYLPSLKTDKLKAKRDYFELNNEHLLVSDEELYDVGRVVYNRELSNFESDQIQRLCSGWFTPIHLVLQNTTINLETGIDPATIGNDINRYLTEDFYDTLNPDLKKFLMKTAHLRIFTSDICDKIDHSNDSISLINKLLKYNLFVEKTDVNEYSYQKLFVKFLLEKQKSVYSTNKIIKLYIESAEVLVEHDRVKDALDILIEINDFDVASVMLYKNFHNLVKKGYLAYCRDISVKLWENIAGKNDELKYTYCYFLTKYDADYMKAGMILSGNQNCSALQDLQLQSRILLLRAEIDILKGEYDPAILILKRLLSSNLEYNMVFDVQHQLGRALFRKGNEFYPAAVKQLEEFIQSDPDIMTDENSAEILNLLGIIHIDSGKFMTAIYYCEKAIELNPGVSKWYKAACNLVIALSSAAKYEKAKSLIDDLEEFLRRFPLQAISAAVSKARENFYKAVGDFNCTIEYVSKLLKVNEKSGNKFLLWTNYYAIAESYYYLGNLAAAGEYLDKCDSHSEGMPGIFVLTSSYLRDRIQPGSEMELRLEEILKYHQTSGSNHTTAIFAFVLGTYYLNIGKYDSAAHFISSALKTARELSYKYFLLNEIPISRIAFDFAIANNIEKNFVFSLYDEFRERANLPWLSAEAKTRLALECRKLTDIRFSPFGKTEFCLRGEKINEDKWIRKKSKVLLAYLMSDPGRVHTKDVIMDMFFGDIPQEKADTMYHSTIYNIRTALKIYTDAAAGEKGSKSKKSDINPQYIVYEDKTLRLNPDFYYVSENDEFEKYCAKVQLTHSSDEEKITNAVKAAELYKGDFMPGYYDGWCEELRVKYKNQFIDICTELVNLLEKHNRPEDVVKYAAMLINEDMLNDAAYIKMIKAYSNIGSKAMAVSCYNTMLKNYEEELGEKPHSKSLAEIKSILDS